LRVLTIIPARSGSKGVKKKNIKLLNGVPLLNWTIQSALGASHKLDEIIVSTDSDEIAQIAKNSAVEVPFIRPKNLATDTAKSIDVIMHALEFMESKLNLKYDWVLTLQPTTPFRSHIDIEQALNLAKNSDCDSVISVVRVYSHHPILMKRIENGKLIPFTTEEKEGTRRQDYSPPAFMRNGAIYLTKREIVVNEKSLWGKDIQPLEMPDDRSINIDSHIDYLIAESMLREKSID